MHPATIIHPSPHLYKTRYSAAGRVWAPAANSVELQLDGSRVPMRRDAHGWWAAGVPLTAGDDYAFIVDGEGPLPDPRSAYQPSGVHGPSRVIDHDSFEWTDHGWQAPPLAAGVIYELHVGTFTPEGTFDGAIKRLDHLRSLGITHVELMPVCESSGRRGWGYDGVDLYAPHHAYGGPEGLRRFVDGCHARGLAVILDVVYNHLGPAGNYLARFGPYFTDRYKTPWGEGVNLDGAGSDEVRRFFIDNALMWLTDYHVDGLRLDAVHAFIDSSATHFVEQLAREVAWLSATSGRHLALIAESDLNDPRLVRAPLAGGYGLDAHWSDDFHHAIHAALTGERSGYYEDYAGLADLAAALQRPYVYAGRYSRHRGRTHGRPADGIPGWRFVVCTQNHDQVGNRAMGERLSQLVSPGRLKIAAALLLTSPFVPMIFQGEEWGASSPFQYFTDHEDQKLAEMVRDGRCREFAAFGWDPSQIPDPQGRETFERSQLRWSELSSPRHSELLEWYRSLITLRQQRPELRDGNYLEAAVRYDEEQRWISVRRGAIVVACNLGEGEQIITMDAPARIVMTSDRRVECQPGAVRLPGESVAILST